MRRPQCVPVSDTRLTTVILCAESKKGRDFASSWSNRDIWAVLALSCAARNRATRCSGVSEFGIDDRAEAAAGFLGPPALGGGGNRGVLEVWAWGVVAVNRVAEAALRSVSLVTIVCLFFGSSKTKVCLLHGHAIGGGDNNLGAGLRMWSWLLARQPEALPNFYDAMGRLVRFSSARGTWPGGAPTPEVGRPPAWTRAVQCSLPFWAPVLSQQTQVWGNLGASERTKLLAKLPERERR
jgi:hypothetical protein